METELGHIPRLVSRWGTFVNLLIFGLLVTSAFSIPYPEVVNLPIAVHDNRDTVWIMDVPDSLSGHIIDGAKVVIAVNEFPTERYGHLAGRVQQNSMVFVEHNISDTGREIVVDSLSHGLASVAIYRTSLFKKLISARF